MVLGRERQVLILQMEALHTEALEAERDLETQYHRHQHELHSLREESLQVRPLPALPLFEPTLPILPIFCQCHTFHHHTKLCPVPPSIPYQVFRVFRQVSEEQRRVSEGRYRTLNAGDHTGCSLPVLRTNSNRQTTNGTAKVTYSPG